jgi:ferredoxin
MRPRLLISAVLALLPLLAAAEERFPPPVFESHYQRPVLATPAPQAPGMEYLDVVVLALALGLASWLALKKRSRRGLFALMLFSLFYFGFWKKGCVCSIGSIQNVIWSLCGGGPISYTVTLFFLLPLIATLLCGRTFCAGVCPFGALQDLALLRPVRVPTWLDHALGLLPFLYLGAAALFAATGSAFIICQYDPFVAFFRLNGSANMLLLGAGILILALFVGRVYCRYICPYGALLGLCARVAQWHVAITPDKCIECRLCEESCPFGAIEAPTLKGAEPMAASRKRLLWLLLALLLLAAGGALLGQALGPALARMHPTVRLAETLRSGEAAGVSRQAEATQAFIKTGQPATALYAEATNLRQRFARGGAWFGGFLGLVLSLKLIELSLRRRRNDYHVLRQGCVACARCFELCPRDFAYKKEQALAAAAKAAAAPPPSPGKQEEGKKAPPSPKKEDEKGGA